MNVLVISSEFPNHLQRTKGIFVKQQIDAMAGSCGIKIIAPIPWTLPLPWHRASSAFSRICREETIGGIRVFHPRFFLIPKICRSLYGIFYFMGILRTAKRIYSQCKYDVILSYFAYPDGFAAVLLSRIVQRPLAIKILGSDINVYTRGKFRRFLTIWALKRADAIIAVSKDLKRRMIDFGVDGAKISIIPNGVDRVKFKPLRKDEARRILNLPQNKSIILFIGGFTEIKGVDVLVKAFVKLVSRKNEALDLLLILIGDGRLKIMIADYLSRHCLQDKVKFTGSLPHEEIPSWMGACDVLCLPSRNEGCPNVILEALSCGRPVIASEVGGIPDLVNSEEYGILVPPGDDECLTRGLERVLNRQWNADVLNRHVDGRSWEKCAHEIISALRTVINPNVLESGGARHGNENK